MVAASLILGLILVAHGGRAETQHSGRMGVEFVDRAIEYHGGARYRYSRTHLEMCSKSGCYDVSATVQGGHYVYRVSGPYRGRTREVLISNDSTQLWKDGSERPVSPEAEVALRDWVMARVYFCFLPFRLDDPSVIQEDLGLESWSGRELRKVKVTFEPGTSTDAEDEFLYWFDPETGRLEQFAYSFVGSPGGLRFRKLYNYRRVGGLLFFDQENLGLDGDDLRVDQITPEFVSTLQPISTVTCGGLKGRSITV